jgi:hypothetical protein
MNPWPKYPYRHKSTIKRSKKVTTCAVTNCGSVRSPTLLQCCSDRDLSIKLPSSVAEWSRPVSRNLQFVGSSQVEANTWRVRALSCFAVCIFIRISMCKSIREVQYMIVWDCTNQPVQSFYVFLWDNRANAGLCIRPWPISVWNSIAPVDKT